MSGDLLLFEFPSEECDGAKQALDAVTEKPAFLQRIQSSQGVTVYQIIVDIALPIALAILPMLPDLVRKHRPKRIKVGKFEIEDPSPEQASRMWQEYLDSLGSPP